MLGGVLKAVKTWRVRMWSTCRATADAVPLCILTEVCTVGRLKILQTPVTHDTRSCLSQQQRPASSPKEFVADQESTHAL